MGRKAQEFRQANEFHFVRLSLGAPGRLISNSLIVGDAPHEGARVRKARAGSRALCSAPQLRVRVRVCAARPALHDIEAARQDDQLERAPPRGSSGKC